MKVPPQYVIGPVKLRVARRVEEVGRSELFHNSRTLLRRLNQIGQRRLVVQSIAEGGKLMPDLHVDALTLYLWAGDGLKYFRRTCRFQDAAAWDALKTQLCIK